MSSLAKKNKKVISKERYVLLFDVFNRCLV